MPKCILCDTDLPDDAPGIVASKLQDLDWTDFEGDSPSYGYPVGKRFTVLDVGEAEVVAKKTTYDGGPYSWGDLPQGTEFDVFVVLRIGEHYYRKDGKGDSYGDITWSGLVRPVTPTEKTVTAYDYA